MPNPAATSPQAAAASPTPARPELVRALGVWDAASLTIGSVIGTGIFLVGADMAKALPHGGLMLLVWLVGGLLSIAGALTYAELGAMYPRAGGTYHFLKEAYGPLPAFLYGWASFLVIMSGGMAALAVGFGEYLGAFLPWFSSSHVLASQTLGAWTWNLTGGQLAAVAAILGLTAVNHLGLRQGAATQNLLTALKVAAIAVFTVAGFLVAAPAGIGAAVTAPLPAGLGGPQILLGFAAAMVGALWTYDGWYGAVFSAGEIRNPARDLPRGLVLGTAAVTGLYLLLNAVYLRALTVDAIATHPRVGEAAAEALFGPRGGQLLSAAVLVSTFGCLSATILYSSRIYQPMADDGLFFRSLAVIDAKRRVPLRSLWVQSLWAVALTLSGTYSQLFTYVVFVAVLFHVATGLAVFVLRRKQPDRERPYRTWGYPWVPALFLLASGALVVSTLVDSPVESALGLLILAIGLPAYAHWRRKAA